MEKVYKEWEKNVINQFYIKSKSDKLTLPKNGFPLYAYKDKVTLVLNFIENDIPISKSVEENKVLPPKQYIQLYHIGEKQMNKTSYGVKDTEFFYPAIDTGGLTNYKQKVGSKPSFLPKKYHIIPSKLTQKEITSIYKTWKQYSKKKKFHGNLKKELTKALRSIKNECYLQYIKVPKEYRVTVTSQDVYNKLGIYYTRVYGSEIYAKETNPKSTMYCGISDKYVTPDINKNNILNEYTI